MPVEILNFIVNASISQGTESSMTDTNSDISGPEQQDRAAEDHKLLLDEVLETVFELIAQKEER